MHDDDRDKLVSCFWWGRTSIGRTGRMAEHSLEHSADGRMPVTFPGRCLFPYGSKAAQAELTRSSQPSALAAEPPGGDR